MLAQPELLVYREGKQVDTCSQIKKCAINCPIVPAMLGQPGSLYLTGIRPNNSSLMLVAKKTFFGYISLSLLGAHVLKKFCI